MTKPPKLTLSDLYPRTHTSTWVMRAITPEQVERRRLVEELREKVKAGGGRPRRLKGKLPT